MRHLAVLARGRAKTEQRMTETVTAGLFKLQTNPDTGVAERTVVTERYAGKAQVKYPSTVVGEAAAASQTVATQDVIVKMPVDAPRLHEGDDIAVTASTADGSLVGRVYRVKGSPQAGQTTSHRYPVREVS